MFGKIVDIYVFCDINQLKTIPQADLGCVTGSTFVTYVTCCFILKTR